MGRKVEDRPIDCAMPIELRVSASSDIFLSRFSTCLRCDKNAPLPCMLCDSTKNKNKKKPKELKEMQKEKN